MRIRRWSGLALLVGVLIGSAHAGEAPDATLLPLPTTPDAAAPPGSWYMEDGCASRSGATRTRVLGEPTERLWELRLPGDAVVEDEPRTWGGAVIVSVRGGPERRSLHVLAAHDGSPLAEPAACDTTLPLRPCVGRIGILIRIEEQAVGLCRIRGGKIVPAWTRRTHDTVHDLLLVGQRAYARVGTDLVCWDAAGGVEQWRCPGSFRSRISVAARDLYAIEYDDAWNSRLVLVDRFTGRRRQRESAGAHVRKGPLPVDYGARVVVLPDEVFVWHDRPLSTGGGKPRKLQSFRRIATSSGHSTVVGGGLFDWHRPPVLAGGGWLTLERDDEQGLRLRLFERAGPDTVRGGVLATRFENEHFVVRDLPYTVAGRTAFVGGQAFDVGSGRVIWESDLALRFRPVPTRDAVLVVEGEGRLAALTSKAPVLRGPLFFGAAEASRTGASGDETKLTGSGRVLFADDRVHEGEYTLDAAAATVTVPRGKRRARKAPLGNVRLVLDEGGSLLYTWSVQDTEETVARLLFFAQANDYYKLAKDAYKGYDPALMRHLLDQALLRGVDPKKLKHPDKQCRALVEKPRKANAARVAKLRAREEALEAAVADAVRAATANYLEDARPAVRRGLLELTLSRQPDHPGAAASVRARVPDYVRVGGSIDAVAWLEVCDVLDRVAIQPVDVRDVPGRDLTPGERELGAARHYWRKDLVGLQSDQLLVMTSLARPRPLAVCLALGETVCDALEEIFEEGEGTRAGRYPLILQLFETREEYVKHALGGERADAGKKKKRTWSAGHYSPSAGVSRIWIGDDEGAFTDVQTTYAHELTHHWMRERCPLYEAREIRLKEKVGGYWIVEGIATFLEGFRWHLATGTWDALNPRAEHLSTVAMADDDDLMPWEAVFATSGRSFDHLKGEAHGKVPKRWRLGWFTHFSERNAFYAQSGAAVFYLYHHSPQTRAALLRYARDYYTGKQSRADGAIQAYFGLSPAQLGQRVEAYALEVTRAR